MLEFNFTINNEFLVMTRDSLILSNIEYMNWRVVRLVEFEQFKLEAEDMKEEIEEIRGSL